MNLHNRYALVTGGGRGIGSSISVRLAREGFFVYVNFRNDLAGATQTANTIINCGGRCEIIRFDVSDPTSVQTAIRKLELPKLDILVNNAGISIDSLIFDLTAEAIEQVINTNFFGACSVFNSCREKLKAARGTIVSIGSIAGAKGRVGQAIYAVSKAMIIEWTARMAELEKDSHMKFYCVSPGPVLTKMVRSTPWARDPKAKDRLPMKRFIEPDEIGDIVFSLVQSGAVLRNGSNVFYDGGFLQTVKA
jgi:3-oxoacyl-[acyl-carrier protein] reductase